MKNRILSFYTLASTVCLAACTAGEAISPEEGVGYIALEGVTTEVVTRAERPVTDVTAWSVTVKDADQAEKFSGTAAELANQAFLANTTYTVEVSNFASLSEALTANSGWGEAWYNGSNTVAVEKGRTATVAVACGTADNARLGVVFDTSFASTAEGYTFTVSKGGVDGGLVFNAATADKYAYYEAGASVAYVLTYTFNGLAKRYEGTVTLGTDGTQKTLHVMLNSNGKVNLSISYDDTFENDIVDITVDGGSGEVING